MSGNALFQRLTFPIALRLGVEHVVGTGDRGRGRAGGGLAEFHVDHRAAGRRRVGGDAVRQGGNDNGVKGFDLCSHGGRAGNTIWPAGISIHGHGGASRPHGRMNQP